MTYLVTGTAGFIGNHVALALLQRGETIIGVDNLTAYYDVALKEARLARLAAFENFTEARIDIADMSALSAVFEKHKPTTVINLAAQAGVRYSIDHPHEYAHSNLTGFLNVLECCRHGGVKHLLYARTAIATFIIYPHRACGFSRFTDLGAARIWLISNSPEPSSKARPSTFTIMATCFGTLPISTILWMVW